MINNRRYKGNCIDDFEIIDDQEIAIPITLCKYYRLTDYSVDSISNSYFYTNHPAEFNDPYDCLRELSIQDHDAYSKYQIIFMYFGIVCLSDNSDSMLMWAHYSGHNGFMINFKTKSIESLFESIHPINYVPKLPYINRENVGVAIMTSANIKSLLWSYEKEWRCFHIPKIPMQFPISNHGLIEFGKKLFDREQIQPEERKLKYDISSIEYVSIGYKLITDEEYTSDIKTDSLKFNLKSDNKRKLIDFLIDNNIPTRMTDLGNVDNFEIINRPVQISRNNNGKFEYILKSYVA